MSRKLTLVPLAILILALMAGCAGGAGSANTVTPPPTSGGGGGTGGNGGTGSGNPATPAPVITAVSPSSATAGTAVTITGSNFGATQGSSTITFNGVAATPSSWSDTSVVVPVPAGATTGGIVITVAGQASNAMSFTVTVVRDITAVNHVIMILQENRSFDSYFGQMTAYRQLKGFPIVTSNGDGKIDDLSSGKFSNSGIQPYHSGSACMENMSPDWAEDRHEVNLNNPAGINPTGTNGNLLSASMAPMSGFVNTAAGISTFYSFQDTTGKRAMGYYNDADLNYYYFLAANFGMGDRFYSPAPTNSPNNHMYLYGATSMGTVHRPGGSESCPGEIVQACPLSDAGCVANVRVTNPTFTPDPSLPNAGKPIMQLLTKNNVSWKVYVTDLEGTCNPKNGTFPLQCALQYSTYLQFFSYINSGTPGTLNAEVLKHIAPTDCSGGAPAPSRPPGQPFTTIVNTDGTKVPCPAVQQPDGTWVGVNDYYTDVKNGTLPNVAFIENGGFSGRDEHPSGRNLGSNTPGCNGVPGQTCINIQTGARFVATLINSLMNSPSWKDSVFFWTMDEGGGAFDHVPPVQVPNPDGIKPVLCAIDGGNINGFTVTAGGSGYTSAPTVVITDSTGTGATATATLTADAVTAITVTNGGTGYTAPTVSFVGGGGSGATATATVTAGNLKDVKVGGDFNITGFRLPNMVISPFSKKNYVSHTPMDYTAILAFIEKRWNIPPLTRRDAFWLNNGADMTEFFDFTNAPWATPPTTPLQDHNMPCDFSLQ